jgi:alanyl-tRNA synthetase
MKADELRKKYLEFFESKGHAILPSASLVPENDPTVLFTTAGMHPLVPYLIGQKHPAGRRLASCQKCIRTSDIDEVGDATHHTFFEMLGNWSLGDYFKKEAIEWSWEFLTDKKWLGLDKDKIAVSVFAGDADAPFDKESFNFWKKLGVPEQRIAKLSKKNNWWGPAGETGPCGSDTEMFYWVGSEKTPESFNDDNDLWVEIWNDVFMEYNKTADGRYEKLTQKNVDTGMGVERVLAALNGSDDNYRNELFWPLIEKIEELSGKKYVSQNPPQPSFKKEGDEIQRAMRVIADHIKAATFILADEKGLTPSNVGAGYVLRRLIRRAVRYGKQLGINDIFTFKIAEEVIKIYQDEYAELRKNKEFILNQLVNEEKKFLRNLERGLIVLNKRLEAQIGIKGQSYKPQEVRLIQGPDDIQIWDDVPHIITGKWLFDFYQTLGFPPQLVIEELKAKNYPFTEVDIENLYKDFDEEMAKHQKLSRTASAGMFKGGLADASEETIKYHTAAHLLLAALRQVLGGHVMQKGSNITAERLRFDFSHGEKMAPEQIKEAENIVNEQIKADLPVACEEMGLDEAKNKGAMGVFDSKYGEMVKVYTIGSANPPTPTGAGQLSINKIISREICGGPHAERTGILGKFKITKEESSSAGVRRIKAVLE